VLKGLPELGNDAELTPDLNLADHGMTSVQIAGILAFVEDFFGVEFPDEALTRETFITPASLWNVVSSLLP
jgi:acyl carrier protein